MRLPADCKISLRPNISLAQYCTMQAGGPAAFFAEPETLDELKEVVHIGRAENLPVFVLGKGSNVVFDDAGYPGIVLSMRKFMEQIRFFPAQRAVEVSAGIHLHRFALACRKAGFGGAEFLASIPGTIGGALMMNAGYSRHGGQKNEIGDLVQEITVLDGSGQVRRLSRDELQFSYRKSNLEGLIILESRLQLWRRHPEMIDAEIRKNFEYRNSKQDLSRPSSGSVFKNPASAATAGQLIDRAGLKGLRIGNMMVSPRHGNYIINMGGGTCSELKSLILKIQETVNQQSGIWLEPEVRIISAV